MYQDVHCPFRLSVPEGMSKFTVMVPREYIQERQFYFADLCLSPDYYNIKSAQEGMDTDQELEATIKHDMYIKAVVNKENLYPDKFELARAGTVVGFLNDVNNFFENHKPIGIKRSAFFFDWIDIAQEESGISVDDFIQAAAIIYYGEQYNPTKHYNALPISLRSLTKFYPALNNYLFPTERSATMWTRLRRRMWIAPNTRVYFSTNAQLQACGFSDEQIGPRQGTKRQFVFENLTKEYVMMQGVKAPDLDLTKTKPTETW